jgi:RimJ/RimL family protein N-acetyltransferase
VDLSDDVIVLRPPEAADVDAIVAACSDEDIVRYVPLIPVPYERADAERWIDRAEHAWTDGSAYPFVIADAATGRLLGAIELRPDRGDIGYWIAAEARGGGAATHALGLILACHSDRPVWLTTHPENAASQRVAEKAGFRRIGLVPHEPAFRDGTTEAVRFELIY